MNAYSAYRDAVKTLTESGCENAEFDARQLVEFCFSLNQTQLLMKSRENVDELKLKKFYDCVERRAGGEPLQYILEEWDFFDLKFKVGKGVLIPRPETEILPRLAIEHLKKSGGKVVYDLCSGSGCVGISIAKFFPNCRVYMFEISDEANYYARQNIKLHNLFNVEIIQADIKKGKKSFNIPNPDIIVSNPPYVPTYDIDLLQKEVLFEPRIALDGGIDGLDFYSIIAASWFKDLNNNGILAMECGENQVRGVLSFFLNIAAGGRVIKDDNDIDRVIMLKGRKKND